MLLMVTVPRSQPVEIDMILRFSALVALLFLVTACTTPIKTEVTRFHALSVPQGETFVVVAKNEAMEGSLELMSYARIVSDYLRAEGFVPAGTGQPDLIVKIGFGISPPVEQRRRSAAYYPFYGSFYYHSGFRHHPYGYWPYHYYPSRFAYGFGYSGYDYSYIVYERNFEMTIQRRNGQVLYEGRAASIGRNKVLPEVMPFLVQAMFTEFPGQSGTTTSVSIKPEKGSGY